MSLGLNTRAALRLCLTGVSRSILQRQNGHDCPYPNSQQEDYRSDGENTQEIVDVTAIDFHHDGGRSMKKAGYGLRVRQVDREETAYLESVK